MLLLLAALASHGGSFMMGSENGDSDEKPVHRVAIQPFRLMEHEVTWAMYQRCIAAGVCSNARGRAGDSTKQSGTQYRWGNDIGSNKANCSGCGSQWDKSKTASVKYF